MLLVQIFYRINERTAQHTHALFEYGAGKSESRSEHQTAAGILLRLILFHQSYLANSCIKGP